MSRFLASCHADLEPYTPGEQPQDMKYIKLNTNESPFPPSSAVQAAVAEEAGRLQLYSDPDSTVLRAKMAQLYCLQPDQVMAVNGSDEALNFAFMAFADAQHPLFFPDITYGFYPVFAQLHHIPYETIPLDEQFAIQPQAYCGRKGTAVLANPNAPTGLCLSLEDIEQILRSNPDNLVIIDEAYVDFGAQSSVPLIHRYDNLLVIQTFSKSRSLAGARLGFAFGNAALIADLNTIRNSTNPYNVNRMTASAGCATLEENDRCMEQCRRIAETREWVTEQFRSMGFRVLPSRANFIFAASDRISGSLLYQKLKERGILIRHFEKPRIREFNRITIGTKEQMEILVETVKTILEELPL